MKKGILKSKNGIMLITLGVVVIMVILIAVIGSMNQGGESVPTIETVAVTKGNVTQEVDASGNVESEQKKTFFSPVNGEIQTMPVEAGDTVEAGQPIIGFNLETLESENQRAQLNVRSGQLELTDAQQQAADAAAGDAVHAVEHQGQRRHHRIVDAGIDQHRLRALADENRVRLTHVHNDDGSGREIKGAGRAHQPHRGYNQNRHPHKRPGRQAPEKVDHRCGAICP